MRWPAYRWTWWLTSGTRRRDTAGGGQVVNDVPVIRHYSVVDDRGYAHNVTKEGYELVRRRMAEMSAACRSYDEAVARVIIECRVAK